MTICFVASIRDGLLKAWSNIVSYKLWLFCAYCAYVLAVLRLAPRMSDAILGMALAFPFGLAVLDISERAFGKWLETGSAVMARRDSCAH